MSAELLKLVVAFKRLDKKRLQEPLSASDEARWQTLKVQLGGVLARKSGEQSGPEEERRDSLRIPLQLETDLTFEKARSKTVSKNLSLTGMYIETELIPAMGSIVRLRLHLSEEQHELETDAKVIWINSAPSPQSKLKKGIGIKFVGMSEDDQKALQAYLHQALGDSLRGS